MENKALQKQVTVTKFREEEWGAWGWCSREDGGGFAVGLWKAIRKGWNNKKWKEGENVERQSVWGGVSFPSL